MQKWTSAENGAERGGGMSIAWRALEEGAEYIGQILKFIGLILKFIGHISACSPAAQGDEHDRAVTTSARRLEGLIFNDLRSPSRRRDADVGERKQRKEKEPKRKKKKKESLPEANLNSILSIASSSLSSSSRKFCVTTKKRRIRL